MIDAVDIVSLNDYNFNNIIKEYQINNLISLDIPNNTELFYHYHCKIMQPSIDLNPIGTSFRLFTSKMTMANTTLIVLNEENNQIITYVQDLNRRNPFVIQASLPLLAFIRDKPNITYFNWDHRGQRLLVLDSNSTLLILAFNYSTSTPLLFVEITANIQISEDRLKFLKTIVYHSNDHLLFIYNSSFGVELYTLTGSTIYTYFETLIKITDIEDVFTELNDLYILTKDKLMCFEFQDLAKMKLDILWDGHYPKIATKAQGVSQIFIYIETDQIDGGTAKLMTIRKDSLSSSSILSSIECEKGAKQIYATENQIILVYSTLVTVYRNHHGYPLLETDLPLNSLKNLLFMTDQVSNKTSILKVLGENQVMLEEIDIRNSLLYCNKKEKINLTSFEFEVRQELCPCGLQHTLPDQNLDCCFAYQIVKVNYHDDLISRMGIGFLFGFMIGCGMILLINVVGNCWVKEHSDTCLFMYSPPLEFDEDLMPLHESEVEQPKKLDTNL